MNVKQVEARLTWHVQKVSVPDGDMEITSDPWARTHTIRIPRRGYREIEYLHELAHAVLAEKHHLLSTAYFEKGTPEKSIRNLVNPIRCASDWFADYLLIQWDRDAEIAEIREHAGYAMMLGNGACYDPFMVISGGLMIAQAIQYDDYENFQKDEAPEAYRQVIPGPYCQVIDALLSVPPEQATVSNKERLINKLAALFCKERVRLTDKDDDNGIEVWQIWQEED